MSSINTKKSNAVKTHEGAPAVPHLTPYQQLRRAVLSCFLWEDQFYEDGESISSRIERLSGEVGAEELAALAREARTVHNLRSVPLLLAVCMVKHHGGGIVGDTVEAVIERADELTEIFAVYRKVVTDGKLDRQLLKGVRRAFKKFSPYNLARNQAIGKSWSLRDVINLAHPVPVNPEQSACFERILRGSMPFPETWQTELSAGADKRETFTRLINEKKLGALDILRNLRNMEGSGVDPDLIRSAVAGIDTKKVFPFRFVAAARACPSYDLELSEKMAESVRQLPMLAGTTVVLVDVSGSMSARLSGGSDLSRLDAAAALASIINAERLRVFSFSDRLVECPPRRGLAGVDAVKNSQRNSGTELGVALREVNLNVEHDRIIVISDEQSGDEVPLPNAGKAYMINVASYSNGVGYGGNWVNISGFSENVLRWIHEYEKPL